jgi:tetratricopeptide (TPR) repeat protein
MPDTPEKLLAAASAARREGRSQDARRDLLAAVDLCRAAADQIQLARALSALGQIERDLRHHDAARAHYQESASIYQQHGQTLRFAHAIRHLADIHRHDGHADLAQSSYEQALALYRDHPETTPLDLANTVRGFAILRQDQGETESARSLWLEARDLYDAAQVKEGVAESSRRIELLTKKNP